MPPERTQKLDYMERWYRDGLRALDPPGGFLSIEADMTEARALRENMNSTGTHVTYAHLLVLAAATVLIKNRGLHRLIAGNTRLLTDRVDICLSIAGENTVTPVLIVKDAGRKSLKEISEEVQKGVPLARLADEKRLRGLKNWGWIVPWAFLRRAFIRFLLNRLWYRRMVSGTFQVSVVPTVDLFVPFLFNTAAALGGGRIRDRVVAINGQVEIRPVMQLTCCFDHKVWNGMDAAHFLNAVKEELEEPKTLTQPTS